MNTVGRFFECVLANPPDEKPLTDSVSWHGTPDWETSFHSTSLTNLPKILSGGLKAGPNALANQAENYLAEVYAEGHRRRHCSFAYTTHVAVPGLPPFLWFATTIECVGDRNRRTTKHDQWAYQSGAIFPNVVYIHVFDLRKAYEPGYVGSCRVHQRQYQALKLLKGSDNCLSDPHIYSHPVISDV